MSEWQSVKLGKIAKLNYGKALKAEDRIDGTIPVYSSAGLTGYHNEPLVNSRGLIVGRKGTVGKVYYSKQPFCCIDTAYYILPDDNTYDFDYLYYLLQTLGLEELNEDSAVPGLNRETAYGQEFLLAPIEEQKAIASVLSSLDDKIDLLHRQNTTLERMAETLFRQWFVEEVQEDWKEGRVSDLVNILSGFAFKSSSFNDNGEFELITIKAVQDGYLELNNADRIQILPEKLPEYCILTYGDILLSLTGNVGRCCVVDSEKLLLNQRVAKLQPKKLRDWAFTYVLFRQLSLKSQLEELAKGTAQANLSPIETANIELKLPPEGLLENFSLLTTPLLDKLLKNKKQIQTLEKLRDNLLPKLMSGEVKVSHEH